MKILEILSVVFLSGIKFSLGLFNATLLLDLGFIPSVLLTILGGMVGVFAFILLDKFIVKYFKKFKKDKIRKVKFSRTRRFIIRVKSSYGLAGIAFLTPILLQVPIGTIIAMRLIKDVRKVSFAMLISFTFFSLVFCSLYYAFGTSFREHFISLIAR